MTGLNKRGLSSQRARMDAEMEKPWRRTKGEPRRGRIINVTSCTRYDYRPDIALNDNLLSAGLGERVVAQKNLDVSVR